MEDRCFTGLKGDRFRLKIFRGSNFLSISLTRACCVHHDSQKQTNNHHRKIRKCKCCEMDGYTGRSMPYWASLILISSVIAGAIGIKFQENHHYLHPVHRSNHVLLIILITLPMLLLLIFIFHRTLKRYQVIEGECHFMPYIRAIEMPLEILIDLSILYTYRVSFTPRSFQCDSSDNQKGKRQFNLNMSSN